MGNGMRIALSALAAGYFGCASILYPAHANAPRGTFVTFDAPAGGLDLLPNGINPAGTITGIYSLLFGNELLDFGFERTPDGRVTTIAVPGTISTIVGSELLALGFVSAGPPINPVGAITGSYFDASGFHGFLRDPDGTFTTFDGEICFSGAMVCGLRSPPKSAGCAISSPNAPLHVRGSAAQEGICGSPENTACR